MQYWRRCNMLLRMVMRGGACQTSREDREDGCPPPKEGLFVLHRPTEEGLFVLHGWCWKWLMRRVSKSLLRALFGCLLVCL